MSLKWSSFEISCSFQNWRPHLKSCHCRLSQSISPHLPSITTSPITSHASNTRVREVAAKAHYSIQLHTHNSSKHPKLGRNYFQQKSLRSSIKSSLKQIPLLVNHIMGGGELDYVPAPPSSDSLPPPPPSDSIPPPPPDTLSSIPPAPPTSDAPPPPPEPVVVQKKPFVPAPRKTPLSIEDILKKKREAEAAAAKVGSPHLPSLNRCHIYLVLLAFLQVH